VIKAGEVMGRSVTVREGGQEAGKIRDLVVDQTGRQVLGFIVAEGLFKGTKVAPWAALQAIGPDSVVLSARSSIVKLAEAADIKAALDSKTSIRGLRLQTTEGKDLGTVEDFYFDEVSGAVDGYEISGGVFADTFGGRSFLPTPLSIELGKDVAFVGPEAEATISQAGGGIKGAFKKQE
jgi:uncharacterized protein YrrD